MTDSRRRDESRANRPLGERGRERPGADVGGIAANADAGLQDALQRRSERRDADPTGATTGSAGAAGAEPRLDLGGKAEPGSAAGAPAPDRSSSGSPTTGHPGATAGTAASGIAGASAAGPGGVAPDPDEPPDKGPVESLGRAVSEVVTGPVQDRDEHDPDTPPRGR